MNYLLTSTGKCKGCYLDGTYFNQVLEKAGAASSTSALTINLEHSTEGIVSKYQISSNITGFTPEVFNYVRVVVDTPTVKHSTLLIVNPVTSECFWWNPRKGYHLTDFSKRLHSQVKTILFEYINSSGNYNMKEIHVVVPNVIRESCNNEGKYGFCTAYVLKYALCHHLGADFTPSNIEGFVKGIEDNFPSVEEGEEDIEYDFSPGGAGLGVLGGVAIGGLLGGSAGAVAGGIAGGLFGSGAFSKQESKWLPRHNIKSHSANECRGYR